MEEALRLAQKLVRVRREQGGGRKRLLREERTSRRREQVEGKELVDGEEKEVDEKLKDKLLEKSGKLLFS